MMKITKHHHKTRPTALASKKLSTKPSKGLSKKQGLLSFSVAFAMYALAPQTAYAEYPAFQTLVPVQVATHTAQLTADTKPDTATELNSTQNPDSDPDIALAATTSASTAEITIDNETATATATDNTDTADNTDNIAADSINTDLDATDADDDFDDAFAIDDEPVHETTPVNDPLEGYNRFMFGINMSVDKNLIRPVASTYQKHTPNFVQKGMSNFFHNLTEPWTSVNLLLQGRPLSSLQSLTRFGVNTVTTLGFADPAASVFDLSRKKEDFGQTLATWGVPAGPYVVLPLFGPSTLRDSGTRFIDAYGSPISYEKNTLVKVGLTGAYGLAKRAKILKFEGIIEPSYEVVRDAYLQKREFDINNGNTTDNTADKNQTQTPDTGFDESFGDE